MSIAYVNSTSPQSGAGTNVSVNVPSGSATKHIMFAQCESDNTGAAAFTSPGWLQLITFPHTVDSGQTTILYRMYGSFPYVGNEPASHTFTSTSGIGVEAAIVTYSGVDTVKPFDVAIQALYSSVAPSSNTFTITANAITSITDNCMLLWLATSDSTTTTAITNINVPSGYTKRFGVQDSSGWNCMAWGEKLLTTAGSQASANATWTQTVAVNVGVVGAHILLRPEITVTPNNINQRNAISKKISRGLAWLLDAKEWW